MAVNSTNLVGMDKLTKVNSQDNQQSKQASEVDFAEYLKNAIDDVKSLQNEAKVATENFVTGKTDNIHKVMVATEKSELALQFTLAVRGKIMDAYNEIMRMQI